VSVRLVVEYRTPTGSRRRVVYQLDSAGLRWLRRKDVYDPDAGDWRLRDHKKV
jgi:DNA-binding PadR family transcriptional regulator